MRRPYRSSTDRQRGTSWAIDHLAGSDEQNGQTLRAFDITDLSTPTLVSELTSNPQAIVHNAHVKGHDLYLANYTEGIRVLD